MGIVKVIPSQVSSNSEVTGNVTGAAVGKANSQVPVHVKLAGTESAWALGAPVAANRNTTAMIQKGFRIFEIAPWRATG